MKHECFPLITQFIYFIIITKITSTRDLSSLRVVCDIRDGLGVVRLDNLPPECTAASSSHNNMSVVQNMTQVPRNVPFLLYFTKFPYSKWGENLDKADDFVSFMRILDLDGLIFNNMYRAKTPGYEDERNQLMFKFFSRLKELNPDGLYGLTIPGHAETLPGAFNYELLDPVIDFYVIKTINFRRCKKKTPMSRMNTKGDMEKVLDSMNARVEMSKVLLTSQLFVMGVLDDDLGPNKTAILSYSDLCGGKKLSVSRSYCKDSLKNIWDKAKIRYDYGMLGVYIKYVDLDDFRGLCHCRNNKGSYRFPGLDALVDGSNNANQNLYKCKHFGNEYHPD